MTHSNEAPYIPPIVCSAMLMEDGLIVPGARHFSPDMRTLLKRIYGVGYHLQVKEEGFMDAKGVFLNRENAWKRAEALGQIKHKVSEPGTLFSENLY